MQAGMQGELLKKFSHRSGAVLCRAAKQGAEIPGPMPEGAMNAKK